MQNQNAGDLAGDKVALLNSGEVADLGNEVLAIAIAMPVEFKIDHRGQGTADKGRINDRNRFANHPVFTQPGDPAQAGRWRKADPFGQLGIGDVCICLQLSGIKVCENTLFFYFNILSFQNFCENC